MQPEMPIARRLAAALYASASVRAAAIPSYLSGEGPRAVAHRIAFAYLDWFLPESPSRRSKEPEARLDSLSTRLLGFQHEDGTVDSDNLRSPPDTAFVSEVLESVLSIAARDPESERVGASLERIRRFCDRAAGMLAVSGIHTPNHRWVVCGALARAYARTGQSAYRETCLDWLGEGIDLDGDGQFSERSSGIYTPVTCISLIHTADGLGMPGLLEPVRRALSASLRLIQPGGEIETIASRRQDQAQTAYLSRQAFPFAFMATRDDDPRFAWAARLALAEPEGVIDQLPLFLAYAPKGNHGDWSLPTKDEAVDTYTAFFSHAGLVRRRTKDLAISIYGGSDLASDPNLPDASGIAGNPSILTFRKGAAVCRWLRFRPRYFDLPAARFRLGHFDGVTASLRWERTVPYFGPLPRDRRRSDGDYTLSTGDGRFWSKLSFGDRPGTNECRLSAAFEVALTGHGCTIDATIDANGDTTAFLDLAFDSECRVTPLDAGGLTIGLGQDRFRILSAGPGAWKDITGKPVGEAGRHANLGDVEGKPKTLVRWAYEFLAPCRFSLAFEVED